MSLHLEHHRQEGQQITTPSTHAIDITVCWGYSLSQPATAARGMVHDGITIIRFGFNRNVPSVCGCLQWSLQNTHMCPTLVWVGFLHHLMDFLLIVPLLTCGSHLILNSTPSSMNAVQGFCKLQIYTGLALTWPSCYQMQKLQMCLMFLSFSNIC